MSQKLIVSGTEITIPDFFDATKIQALFDSFSADDSIQCRIENLICLSRFLGLKAEIKLLMKLLDIAQMVDNREAPTAVIIPITELYRMLQKSIFDSVRLLMGCWCLMYLESFVAI